MGRKNCSVYYLKDRDKDKIRKEVMQVNRHKVLKDIVLGNVKSNQ